MTTKNTIYIWKNVQNAKLCTNVSEDDHEKHGQYMKKCAKCKTVHNSIGRMSAVNKGRFWSTINPIYVQLCKKKRGEKTSIKKAWKTEF